MKGHKYLILGNHDSKDIIKNYPKLKFEMVFVNPVKINDMYFSHEPLLLKERNDLMFQLICDEFQKCSGLNYHGHIHNPSNFSTRYQNVSCEALDYSPTFIGFTGSYTKNELPLFINSRYFSELLELMWQKNGVTPNLLISDYVYSYILECLNDFQHCFFVQGSFGLLKKYNFFSNMSDIDLSFLPLENQSKNQAFKQFKTIVDMVYQSLKNIDGINLSFLKRFYSLKIFEVLYTSRNPYFSQMFFDANLIFLNCYQPNDFILKSATSMIETCAFNHSPQFLKEYKFPHFQSSFLIPEGDIANILLQLFFQKGFEQKKRLLLKKLQFTYQKSKKTFNPSYFENIFCRLFLRNIALFYTLRRFGEIIYIQNSRDAFKEVLSNIPTSLSEQINDLFMNEDSNFIHIFNEMASDSVDHSFQKCEKLSKELKNISNHY